MNINKDKWSEFDGAPTVTVENPFASDEAALKAGAADVLQNNRLHEGVVET